ncbi:MAG: hypothetical protein FVQ83_09845 [Chloroflexi bacterium]|nr:hypothetical protein [Chloroflexota bacterium]
MRSRKFLLLVISIAWALGACSPAQATESSPSTATLTPIPTATKTPTPSPTLHPTLTPTPTITPLPDLPSEVQAWIDNNQEISYDRETGIATMLVEVGEGESREEVFRVNQDGSIGLETTTFDGVNDSQRQEIEVSMDVLQVEPKKGENLLIDTGERVGWIYRDGSWREILLDIEFETSGENINILPEIYPDDVTSGRLAEAERLEAPSFSDEVEMIGFEYSDLSDGVLPDISDEQINSGVFGNLNLYGDVNNRLPLALPFFYKVMFEDQTGVLITMQYLNPDRTVSFLHMANDVDSIENNSEHWQNEINLKYMPLFDPGIGDFCDWDSVAYFDLYTDVVCSMNLPYKDELEGLMHDWVESGQVPEELERVIAGQSWVSRWW